MDHNTLFTKTDKGREALTSRPPDLGPRLRSLLILVDGKRTVAELDKLCVGLGGSNDMLVQLEAAGWIQVVGGQAAAQPRAAVPVPAARVESQATAALVPDPAGVAPALAFPEARRLLVRYVNDQLGPAGEALAIRIEACKSASDLQGVLPRVRDHLRNFKGNSAVQIFDAEVVVQLPLT